MSGCALGDRRRGSCGDQGGVEGSQAEPGDGDHDLPGRARALHQRVRPALLPLWRRGEREELVVRTPEKFAEKDIEVLCTPQGREIDAQGKTLSCTLSMTGRSSKTLTTGSSSPRARGRSSRPFPGVDLDGVFELRFLTDADEVQGYMRERSPEKATIVGGGTSGLRSRRTCAASGWRCSLIEGEDRVALAYGPEVSERVEAELAEPTA